jgi:hypothetical protein
VVYRALDEGVSTILKNAPHIYSLTLDFNLTKSIHCFPQTSSTLTRVRTVRNLRLATFLVPMCMAENDSLPQERTPGDQAPPAYERVSLRVGSGARLPLIMQDPRNLRWFGFTVVGIWIRGDKKWDMTLQRVAEAATELETLVLGNAQHFDVNALGQLLQSGFVRVSEVVSPVLVADKGMNGHLDIGTWGPRKAEVILGECGHPQPIEPETTLLRLHSFFCHALENHRQPLRNMASRHWSSIYY